MEYTDQEKIVNPEDGEGGWVDTHPSNDVSNEGFATAEMSSEEKVYFMSFEHNIFLFIIFILRAD